MYSLFYFKKICGSYYLVSPKLENAPKTLKRLFPFIHSLVVRHTYHDFKIVFPSEDHAIMFECYDMDDFIDEFKGCLCVQVWNPVNIDYDSIDSALNLII